MDISDFPEIAAEHSGAARLSVAQGKQRLAVQEFIAEQFARAHQARIKHFMPVLLSLNAANGELAMVCGLRAAAVSDLFLEQYLVQPVETALAAAAGKPIARNVIVEVGNLAVSTETPARHLIIALTRYLAETPMQWVVCTVLPQLRNSFTRLGIAHHELGVARLESLLPAERADWGNYYTHQPTVIAINVAGAMRAIERSEQATT
jgi:hypothetical protein